MRRNNLKKRNKKPVLAFLLIFLLLFSVFVIVFELRAAPVIKEVAASQAENITTNEIEKAIIEVLEQEGVTYSSLVDIEKDEDGRITAIKADTVKMNSLKSRISEVVSQKILDMDSRTVKIPLGTVLGVSAFSGKGPKVKTKVTLSSNINTKIENSFTSAGINQTLHEILVIINANLYVVMPGSRATAQVDTNFCIAQTVIIGGVPDTYAQFQKDDKNE